MSMPPAQWLRLDAQVTIREVAALHPAWQALAADGTPLRIDGEAVARIDAAGLQLLLALVRQIEARGHTPEWRQPSGALIEAATQLGLSEHLRLPQSTHD